MTRVAIVNDVAGVARLEVEALREAGWDADFHDLPKPGARWPRWIKPLALPLRMLLAVPTIMRLRRGGYDIVHVHFVSQGFVGAASGRPYVLHAHGSDLHRNLGHRALRAWSRRWMSGARVIFYVTPNLRHLLAEFASKGTLLPNPVDTARFARLPAPESLERVLLFMRLDPIKGAATALAAVDRLATLTRVSAMDWGPQAPAYKAAFATRVEFIKPVPHADVPALLSRFDAVIGQMLQGVLGLSELEALAAGRAVLMRLEPQAADADPAPVLDVANADQLVERMSELKADPERLRQLSAEGRRWVERHHSLAAHARALIDAYETVSAAGRTKSS